MATHKSVSRFPRTIQNMISSAKRRGMTVKQATTRINRSATARKLGVDYTVYQISAAYRYF